MINIYKFTVSRKGLIAWQDQAERCLQSQKWLICLQLEAIKKERGPSVEDGTVARDKTLAAILAENKAQKEEQFANVWKTMKQGL